MLLLMLDISFSYHILCSFIYRKDLFYEKFIILIVMVSFILASCGNHSKTDKDTLNIDIPLKTKSIAPYETDIPVKVGALESLFKMSKRWES